MAVGVAGLILLLGAFALGATGTLSQSSILYQLMNAIGAFMLAFYALAAQNYIFLILEGAWAAVAVYGLAKALVSHAGSPPRRAEHAIVSSSES